MDKHVDFIVEYYNRITKEHAQSISDIPIDVLDFLTLHEPDHFVYGFVSERILTGRQGRDKIAKFFQVNQNFVRKVGKSLQKYKKG